MRRLVILLLLAPILPGCSYLRSSSTAGEQAAQVSPVAMRIHPIFTRVKDWDGDNIPDGIDALLEFQDQFGDATKASGRVIFELYSFQRYDPERRGKRLANPWVASLESVDDQTQRWNRTSRTYDFPLAFPQVNANNTYVLTAQFQRSNGGRFYDQMILEPPQGAYAARGATAPTTSQSELIAPATMPSTMPSTAPSTPPSTMPTTAPTGVLTSGPTTEPSSQP